MINNALYECERVSRTRTIKFVHFIKRFKNQLIKGNLKEKKAFFKWLFGHINGKNGIHKEYNPIYSISDMLVNEEISTGIFQRAFNEEADNYKKAMSTDMPAEVKRMRKILENTECKGIVVYPHIIHWETTQTPQHLLRELAKQGYICIFAEHNNLGHILREVEKNLYVMCESDMIASVYDKNPIIFCTWACSMGWIEKIEKKRLWYHILDKIDIFACYDDDYESKHREIINKADLVTYVAVELKRYAVKREDAVYLPNGVNVDDFIVNLHDDVVPREMKNIISSGRKIIGYYGLISTWFDLQLVAEAADRNKDWVFVLIGDCNIDLEKYSRENIISLGKKDYKELADYAKFFDVAVIPFEISDMMDCVSPIKFFEYRALGLPVVSSYMKEMEQYASDDVLIAYDADDFCECINKALEPQIKQKAQNDGLVFAKKQLWRTRAEVLDDCFSNF